MAKKIEEKFGEPQYLLFNDGVVVRIRHPILTPEERSKRMQELHDAAADYLQHVADVHGGVIPKYERNDGLTTKWISKEEYQRLTGRED